MTQAEINYNAGASHRLEIQKEINANPVRVDRSVFSKTEHEKMEVQNIQRQFKHNGLREWNERNRPGNNRSIR